MPGTLAYVDTYGSGLVPCQVVASFDPHTVAVRVTAKRGGYPLGTVHVTTVGRVVPRDAVYVRAGMFRICGAPIVAYPAPAQDFDDAPTPAEALDAASSRDVSARLVTRWRDARKRATLARYRVYSFCLPPFRNHDAQLYVRGVQNVPADALFVDSDDNAQGLPADDLPRYWVGSRPAVMSAPVDSDTRPCVTAREHLRAQRHAESDCPLASHVR